MHSQTGPSFKRGLAFNNSLPSPICLRYSKPKSSYRKPQEYLKVSAQLIDLILFFWLGQILYHLVSFRGCLGILGAVRGHKTEES